MKYQGSDIRSRAIGSRRCVATRALNVGAWAALIAVTACLRVRGGPVPRLDELAGEWMPADTLKAMPALNSALGSAQAARDALAIEHVDFPPLTMAGDTGALLVNGRAPRLVSARWFPYQVARRSELDGLRIESLVRMPYEERGLLFHLEITNPTAAPVPLDVRIPLTAIVARHANWAWAVPRKGDDHLPNRFDFATTPSALTSGEARWQADLAPGKTWSIDYCLAVDDETGLAHRWAGHFAEVFDQVPRDWQERFEAMFRPGNGRFSGYLPTLDTSDAAMRRLYYMSAVSLLSVLRTDFPIEKRVYVSNTPQSNCTMMYFWDTREWATSFALLDPAVMKDVLRGWLARGIGNGYAEEYLTGTLRGPWYSANDYSVFILLDAYLNVTGDRAFLDEKIAGKTVLDHLDSIAIHWKSLVRPGRTLADYGKRSNLLECVPTYINEVPSFNAVNVWMMRRVAAIDDATGHRDRAAWLRGEAARLLPAVLDLYEPGVGVWYCLHRDGSRVEARHVFDFATIGLTIPDDLTSRMKSEMTAFVERELITDHWMRAQSLSDVAAAESNRPDHGPMGAFCAWPPETIAAFGLFHEHAQALDLLRRCVWVTKEGPFSQSRALLTRSPDSDVRIAPGPQTYNASNGSSFGEVIIRECFGFQPDWISGATVPDRAPRGFTGTLRGVRQAGRTLDLASGPDGIAIRD